MYCESMRLNMDIMLKDILTYIWFLCSWQSNIHDKVIEGQAHLHLTYNYKSWNFNIDKKDIATNN